MVEDGREGDWGSCAVGGDIGVKTNVKAVPIPKWKEV